jgi:hypothetical protein
MVERTPLSPKDVVITRTVARFGNTSYQIAAISSVSVQHQETVNRTFLSTALPQTGKRKVKWRSLPDCKTKRDAQKQCAALITEISSGSFIQTNKTTLGGAGITTTAIERD